MESQNAITLLDFGTPLCIATSYISDIYNSQFKRASNVVWDEKERRSITGGISQVAWNCNRITMHTILTVFGKKLAARKARLNSSLVMPHI